MQMLGTWHHAVAYLSKQLHSVIQGWPSCLWALAAMALLVLEADKLTVGQELTLCTGTVGVQRIILAD